MPAAQPQEIRLVAGLGNPGEEYENTRHNAGFRAIEELGERLGAGYWKSQCGAKVAVVRVRGQEGPREVILAMPQDFMNTSGGPISKLCREYRVAPEGLLVIHDELDLDPGDVRVKVGGGANRNGLNPSSTSSGQGLLAHTRWHQHTPGACRRGPKVLKRRNAEMEDVRRAAIDAADAAEMCLEHGVVFARDRVNGAGKPGSR